MPSKIKKIKKQITLKKVTSQRSNVQEIPYKRHNYTVYPNTVKQHRFKSSA